MPTITRPRHILRAAELGRWDSREHRMGLRFERFYDSEARATTLTALLGSVPPRGHGFDALLPLEAEMEAKRQAGADDYDEVQHVKLWSVMLMESELLPLASEAAQREVA